LSAGFRLIVDHLVSLGHRRIAHADGGGFVSAERRRAYAEAMAHHGLEPLTLPGGETEQDGIRAAEALDPEAGVTAVAAYNDRCAIGVLDHFDRAGVDVPGQMSVTGYDNSFLAQLAVEAVIERLDGDRLEGREIILKPHLVVRGRTGTVAGPLP
jgi:DNA-binding LacI/PurR family transcriptional regulator